MQTRRTSAPSMVRALVRFLVLAYLIFAVVFYGGVGWYFTDVFREDALDIDPHEPEFDIVVTAASADTVALIADVGTDARADGWFGIQWETGSGLVGPIMERIADTVVREFVHTDGDELQPGDMVHIDPWMWSDPETGFGAEYELVTFDAPLGELEAWRVLADDSTDWIVTVHGKGATKQEGLRIASIANRAGYNSLLIDYRNDEGAPQDPSEQYRYGATEWEDVASAVEYVRGQGASRIVIVGLSTGAAHTLSFMYRSELVGHVDGLIFDSPNIDMEQTVRHEASQTELPVIGFTVPGSLATSAMWIAERRFSIDFDEWNYLSAVDTLDVPMLVIHGNGDLSVPHAVSVDLVTARPDIVTYEEFPAAGHVASWNSDRTRYDAVVTEFLGRDL